MDDPSLVWLLLAAATGIGGWLLGRQSGRHERAPGSRDYQLGLDHLLHGRVDAALKVLDGVAAGDDDALELQFALGSLFRKRGEVDRATGLHELLVNHQSESVRERARFELALDFVAAGLFDRAEQRLQQLAAAGPHRVSAQLQLLRLCEIQSDWFGALRLHQELPAPVQRERSAVEHSRFEEEQQRPPTPMGTRRRLTVSPHHCPERRRRCRARPLLRKSCTLPATRLC